MNYYRAMTETYLTLPGTPATATNPFGTGRDLIVTGHSKGANLADYVTIVAQTEGGPVGHSYTFDGQGFNEAFNAKYADAITQLRTEGAFHRTAASLDFVNILLYGADPETTYRTGTIYDVTEFATHHSPFALFTDNSEQCALLTLADESNQSLLMYHAAGLMDYLFKFMADEDRLALAGLFSDLMTEKITLDSIAVDPKLWKDLAIILVTSPNAELSLGAFFKGEYSELIDRLMPFVVAYADSQNLDTATVLGILESAMPGLTHLLVSFAQENPVEFAAGTAISIPGAVVLDRFIENSPALPYSTVVRDYSDTVLNQLRSLLIVIAFEPVGDFTRTDLWYRIQDMFADTDIPTSSAKLNDYYRRILDMKGFTWEQIRQIFDNVRAEDQAVATTINGLTTQVNNLTKDITGLVAGPS